MIPFKTVPKGFVAATSDRLGGVSAAPFDSLNLGSNTEDESAKVLANRRAFAAKLGLSPGSLVFMRQVHGCEISPVGADQAGAGLSDWSAGVGDCDGLMTSQSGLGLCVGHADCLAVLMADPLTGLIGAAHAGWRGAQGGIAGQLAKRFLRQLQSDPERLWVGLSVCIGPDHLELGEAQYRLFEAHPGHDSFCSPLKNGHFFLDLWACVTRQLTDLGIPEANFEVQRFCTACEKDRFFSHRRDQGKTGRMLSVIARRP